MERSRQDLSLIIQSRIPIVVIESHEEQRVLDMISQMAQDLHKPMFSWAITCGLRSHLQGRLIAPSSMEMVKPETVLTEIKNVHTPSIYVLCDYHPYLENAPHIVRMLKEIAIGYEFLGHTVILLSGRLELTEELKPYAAVFELPMPDAGELELIIREEAQKWSKTHQGIKVVTHPATLQKMVRSLMGLPRSDARRLARNAIYHGGAITESDLPEVNKAKFEMLGMDGVLSFEYETASFADVGGLKNLKKWLKSRKAVFSGEAENLGLDPPKGIMLLGVQGSGKSLAAKAVAGLWEIPLLRLDFGTLYNKFFGESERNLRNALKTAQLMAPCVLWIDEIEKGVASDSNDTGTSRRILGTLLTWMSERKSPVFIVATSNDISSLPPELIRKGRLDEIFFVNLPTRSIRKKIFKIHLKKRNQSPEKFDMIRLAQLSKGYSGAEIEQVVVAGLYHAMALKTQLSTQHLITEIKNTHPLSVVMSEQVEALQLWAEKRTVFAD